MLLTPNYSSAEDRVREVASHLGLPEATLEQICQQMKDEYVLESWQLPGIDSFQWVKLNAPIGLAAAMRQYDLFRQQEAKRIQKLENGEEKQEIEEEEEIIPGLSSAQVTEPLANISKPSGVNPVDSGTLPTIDTKEGDEIQEEMVPLRTPKHDGIPLLRLVASGDMPETYYDDDDYQIDDQGNITDPAMDNIAITDQESLNPPKDVNTTPIDNEVDAALKEVEAETNKNQLSESSSDKEGSVPDLVDMTKSKVTNGAKEEKLTNADDEKETATNTEFYETLVSTVMDPTEVDEDEASSDTEATNSTEDRRDGLQRSFSFPHKVKRHPHVHVEGLQKRKHGMPHHRAQSMMQLPQALRIEADDHTVRASNVSADGKKGKRRRSHVSLSVFGCMIFGASHLLNTSYLSLSATAVQQIPTPRICRLCHLYCQQL